MKGVKQALWLSIRLMPGNKEGYSKATKIGYRDTLFFFLGGKSGWVYFPIAMSKN